MTVIPPYVIENTRHAARSTATDFVHGERKTVLADWSPGDMTRYQLFIAGPTDGSPGWTVENLGVPGVGHKWDPDAHADPEPDTVWWPNNEWACQVIAVFLEAFRRRVYQLNWMRQ